MPRMVEGQVPPALISLLALASGVERVDRAKAQRRGDWRGSCGGVIGGGCEGIEYTVSGIPLSLEFRESCMFPD